MHRSDLDRRQFLQRAIGAGLALGTSGIAACAKASSSSAPAPAPTKPPAPAVGTSRHLGDLETLTIRHSSGSTATIARQGAHVTSWKRANGEEMLFLSETSRFAPGEMIRGGIPVIFPQFAKLEPLPEHGLLATVSWEIAEVGRDPGAAAFALLRTADTDATRALWPHPFRATLRVTLDDGLATAITIENTGDEPFSFQCALHTHHHIGDLRRITIQGLERARYQDRVAAGALRTGSRAPLRIRGEVNRIYLHRPDRIRIRDEARGRTVLVDRAGFGDVVIWNPGGAKGREDSGLADGEYVTMLAVEPAQIDPPVQLAPGSLWSGVQRIHIA
jgi:glucose-6-phosphate 1-epimerase